MTEQQKLLIVLLFKNGARPLWLAIVAGVTIETIEAVLREWIDARFEARGVEELGY